MSKIIVTAKALCNSVPWNELLLTGLVAAFILYDGANSKDTSERSQALPPPVPGWMDLIPCSQLVSLDGTKEIVLFETHKARLTKMTAADGARDLDATFDDGSWSFAESTKSYVITIDNKSIDYKLIAPEASHFCMLIRGSLESANLRDSWFSTEVDQSMDDDILRYDRYGR